MGGSCSFARFSAAAAASLRWASGDIFGGMGGGADDFGEDDFIISSMRARFEVFFGDVGGVVDGMMSGCVEMFVVGVVDSVRWFLLWPICLLRMVCYDQ